MDHTIYLFYFFFNSKFHIYPSISEHTNLSYTFSCHQCISLYNCAELCHLPHCWAFKCSPLLDFKGASSSRPILPGRSYFSPSQLYQGHWFQNLCFIPFLYYPLPVIRIYLLPSTKLYIFKSNLNPTSFLKQSSLLKPLLVSFLSECSLWLTVQYQAPKKKKSQTTTIPLIYFFFFLNSQRFSQDF